MDAQALGRYLRETRESKDLRLRDAEEQLRIRRSTLEAFELGDFNIPDASIVQIRGFLRNYALYLDLDPDLVLGYYQAALVQDDRRKRRGLGRNRGRGRSETDEIPIAPKKITDTPPALPPVPVVDVASAQNLGRRSIITTLLQFLIAVAAVIVIVFVGLQLIQQAQENRGATVTAEDPPPADAAAASVQGPTPLAPVSIAPTPTSLDAEPLQDSGGGGIQIVLEMTQRAFIRVIVDGDERFAEMAVSGDILEFSGTELIEVTSSSGTAFDLVYNGEDQAISGNRGRQLQLVFTATDVQMFVDDTLVTESAPVVPPTASSGAGVEPEQPSDPVVAADSVNAANTAIPTAITPPTRLPSPTQELIPTLTPFPGVVLDPAVTDVNSPTAQLPATDLTSLSARDLLDAPLIRPDSSDPDTNTPQDSGADQPVIASADPAQANATPAQASDLPTAQPPTETATPSLTPTRTSTPTPTASPTPNYTPTPTAILPMRVTAVDATPKKDSD